MITSKERVLKALHRKGYDRLPVRYMGEPHLNRALMDLLGLSETEQTEAYSYPEALVRVLGDDFRYVQPKWNGPAPKTYPDESFELVWPARGWPVPVRYTRQTYGENKAQYIEVQSSPFKNITDPKDIENL